MCYAPALVGGGFGPSGGHLQCDAGSVMNGSLECQTHDYSTYQKISQKYQLKQNTKKSPKVVSIYFFFFNSTSGPCSIFFQVLISLQNLPSPVP